MKNSKLIYYGIINSLGVFIYTSGIAWFLFNGKRLFNNEPDTFWQPLMMLLLLVISAAITGSLVFGKPIYLYLEGFKTEAIKLLCYVIIALFLIMIMVVIGNIFW